jgi:hypothetical protein
MGPGGRTSHAIVDRRDPTGIGVAPLTICG